MTTAAEQTRPNAEALRALLETPGPWASVYIGLTDQDPQGRPVERSARWQGLATALRNSGTPDELVARIGSAVQAEPPGPAVLAVFSSTDGRVTTFRVPGPLAWAGFGATSAPDRAHFGALPRILPLLGWLQAHPPHVVVRTDRTGADLDAVAADGRSWHWTVTGSDDEIERNAPGGWAQGRYQNRAEDSWAHNAARVAQSVASAIRASGARLLLVAGDVRAVQLLEEQLPTWVRNGVEMRKIGGGRSADGSQRTLPERVDEVIGELVDEEVGALLERFDGQRARAGRSVEDVQPTVESLANGEVETLLLVPDTLDERAVWYGRRPNQLAADSDELARAGWGPAALGPLPDIATRAALGTRAEVWFVPEGLPGSPAEGIGAIRRFR